MEAPASETPAQRQARIRREKREKKVLEGGASRLDKITSLSGRPAEQAPAPSQTPTETSTYSGPQSQIPQSSPQAAEPSIKSDLVDQNELEASMRRLLRDPGSDPNAASPGSSQSEDQPDDPMMRLLQQMMGAPPPGSNDTEGTSQPGALPPNLAAMLGGGSVGGEQSNQSTATNAYIWKIAHACFALALAFYILVTFTFTGSLASRLRFASGSEASPGSVFWVFLTAELGLQAARYLMEGTRQNVGMLGTIANFLPSPWNGRLLLAGRYSGILTVLVEDAMVVVWMLGVVAWWNRDSL